MKGETWLHITTDECEVWFDKARKREYCISCRCWFSVATAKVLSIYDADTPRFAGREITREEWEADNLALPGARI